MSISCPDCMTELVQTVDPGAQVCQRCNGLWVQEAMLVARLAEATAGRTGAQLELRGMSSGQRRRCPACDQRMDVVGLETVVLDRCTAHGLWLDRGEYEQALSSAAAQPRAEPRLPTAAEAADAPHIQNGVDDLADRLSGAGTRGLVTGNPTGLVLGLFGMLLKRR